MKSLFQSAASAATVLASIFALQGQALADDVSIQISAGKMFTAAIPENGGASTLDRVFQSEFFGVGPSVFTDEPGFQVPDGTLPSSSFIGVNIRKAVRVWNGADFLTNSVSTITLEYGPNTWTSSLTDSLVVGPQVQTDLLGGLHEHPSYYLDTPHDDGIFLLELELTSSAGLQTTDPFWLVFNWNQPVAQHEAAIQWVRDTLVPAPTSLAVLGAFGVFASRRRRA